MKPILFGDAENIVPIVIDLGINFWTIRTERMEEGVLEEAFAEMADRHRQLMRDGQVLGVNMDQLDELIHIELQSFMMGNYLPEPNLIMIEGARPFITFHVDNQLDDHYDEVDGYTIDQAREALDQFKSRRS